MARLVRFEEEEYAAPTRRLVKRDLETGEVEVLGGSGSGSSAPLSNALEDGAAASLPADGGEGAWPPPLTGEEKGPLEAEESQLARAGGPQIPGQGALVLALLGLAGLGLLWSRWRRRRRRRRRWREQGQQQPEDARDAAQTRDRLGPLLRRVGLWTPAGLARVSAEAAAGRALLDAALQADDPTAARGALTLLEELVGVDVPGWLHEALAPLPEERAAVGDVEGHHGRLLRDLEQAAEAGHDALEEEARSDSPLGTSSSSASAASASLELDLIAAIARIREALKAHGNAGAGDGTAAARLAGTLEDAEAVLAAIQHGRDERVQRQIDAIRVACQRGLDASSSQSQSQSQAGTPAAPSPSQQQQTQENEQQQAPPLLLQNGEGPTAGVGLGGTEANSEPAVAAVSSSSSSSSSERGHALVPVAVGAGGTALATVETTSTAVVMAGGGQQDSAALLSQLSQSIQMSTMLSTMASRIGHLEEKLERQRERRGAHALRTAGAARKERQERGERLRQRVRELAAERERREGLRLAAEEARRQGDQTLLTYLLPVTFLVFGAGVVLATSDERGAPSAFLIDALWRVPLHDLVYGACAKPMGKAGGARTVAGAGNAASPPVKVVHHKARPIAGAAAPAGAAGAGGLPWPLQALVDSVLPAGGVAEMGACYVRHTVYLAVGLVAAALLHHLMGGLGLSRHRAKLHVAMLAYAFQRHILRVTWRGLRSLRHLLALHALLWLAAAGLDAGHAFARRRLWLRGVVPAALVVVALYDAAVYVDPARPLQALHLMGTRALEACLSGLGADEGGGGEL